MKIEFFSFRLFHTIMDKKCKCGRLFSQVLRIMFDARPNNEWEVMALCTNCGKDWTDVARVAQVFGSGKNMSLKDLGNRMKDSGL